jgi:hypothetical protein
MKKSDMLDILQNFFQSDCGEIAHDARISAERILAIMEKQGMRPPWFTQKFAKDSPGEYYYPDGMPSQGWEDETK